MQQAKQATMSPAPPLRQVSDPRIQGFSAHTPQATQTPRPQPVPVPASAISRYQPNQASTPANIAPAQIPYTNYKAPQPVEVWQLSDAANQAIPPDVREQFQRDENGHVLFFSAPPLAILPSEKQGAGLGHSVKYLAAKLKREEAQKKRTYEEADGARQVQLEEERRAKLMREHENAANEKRAIAEETLRVWEQQMVESTKREFQELYGVEWKEKMGEQLDRLMPALQ